MEASFHNLIKEFKAVVFEKDKLEIRVMSELKTLLPLLVHEDFNSDVEF